MSAALLLDKHPSLPGNRKRETSASLPRVLCAWATSALFAIHSLDHRASRVEYAAALARSFCESHQWILCPGCYCLRNRSDFFHSYRREAFRSAASLVTDSRSRARWRFAWVATISLPTATPVGSNRPIRKGIVTDDRW